jgi:hypothetical protein
MVTKEAIYQRVSAALVEALTIPSPIPPFPSLVQGVL